MGWRPWKRAGSSASKRTPFKDRVEVAVSDSGSGIPEDQIGKIFNYYYTTKEKGAGLGLPIAHRIIEAHSGQAKGGEPRRIRNKGHSNTTRL